MAATLSDKFRKGAPFFQTTLGGSMTDSDTTFTLASATGLPTDTAMDFTIDRIDQNGELLDPSLREVITGTISGTTITTDASRRGQSETTAQSHLAGAVVEVNFTADTWNDAIDGFLVSHNADGTLKNDSVDTAQIADDAVDTAQIADDAVTAAKIATLPVKRQNNTTDTDTSAVVLSGWGVMTPGAVSQNTETVTFGVTFAQRPIVVICPGGDHGSSTTYGDGGLILNRPVAEAHTITTTNFKAQIYTVGGTNFGATQTVFYQWIAIGELA